MVTMEEVDAAIAERGWLAEDQMMRERTGTSCGTCWGYGIWAVGDPVPMGPGDSRMMPTQPCPECGANPHPLPEERPG